VQPHFVHAAGRIRKDAQPGMAARVVSAGFLAGVAVLAVVLVLRWTGRPAEAPKTAIQNRANLPPASSAPPRVNHQPTVLQADSTSSPRAVPSHPASPSSDGVESFVGDKELTNTPPTDRGTVSVPRRDRLLP
jgi:hypothetical protein